MARTATLQTAPPLVDDSTLRAIQRLRNPTVSQREYMDSDSLIRALVQEVDETVLPRQLSLLVSKAEICSVTVACRGVVGFSFPTPPKDQPDQQPAKPLAVAAYLLRSLRGLCPVAGPFHLHHIGPIALGSAKNVLCTAQDLQSSLTETARSPVDDFFVRLQPKARARLQISQNADPERQARAPSDLAILEAYAARLPGLETASRANSFALAPTCTLFPCPTGAIVAVVADRSATRLLLLDRSARNDLQQEWARCMQTALPAQTQAI